MNTKMKVLSLALVGLAGFAGSAMAACPNGPTVAEGRAWSSKTVLPATSALSNVVDGEKILTPERQTAIVDKWRSTFGIR